MKTTEQMLIDAKAAGVTLAVTTALKGAGQVALLPGVRRPAERNQA